MDTLVATQQYIHEMARLAGPGMKTSMITCAIAQSEMMTKEVYLFELIDVLAEREPLKFLKCVVFLRPTPENLQLLSEELRNPKYGQYYLYFSNIISKADLKILAEADEYEVVREVHEFYMDSIPLAPHLSVTAMPLCYESTFTLSLPNFRRCIQALLALCLQFKKKPAIRFQKSCKDAQRLSEEFVKMTVREDKLFESCRSDTVIVIMDRSEDPVSPLLNQWTYEAMVHELIGLKNNRVNAPEEGLKNIVLSAQHDEFYAKNRYLNFGEIGHNIQVLINEYQKNFKTHQEVESITDMKRFIDQYPQFKKIAGTTSKHVLLVSELSKIVNSQNLLETSELEQSIVAVGDHSQCLDKLKRLLQNEKTTNLNALRLAMLYALRWENSNSNALSSITDLLKKRGVTTRQIESIQTLLKYAGTRRRHSDLFGTKSAGEIMKRVIKNVKGVENVYTQHEPYIAQIIEQLMRGRLNEAAFGASDPVCLNTRYDNIVIFIIGGATMEESAYVNSINEKRLTNPGMPKVLLASTCIHNTKSFIDQLVQLTPEYSNVASFASVA